MLRQNTASELFVWHYKAIDRHSASVCVCDSVSVFTYVCVCVAVWVALAHSHADIRHSVAVASRNARWSQRFGREPSKRSRRIKIRKAKHKKKEVQSKVKAEIKAKINNGTLKVIMIT